MILFICKNRTSSYGCERSSGLVNSATFAVNMFQDNGLEAKLVHVHDANGIDRMVHKFHPRHVILEALWVTPDKMAELLRIHKKAHWIVQVHSKIPFLSMEGIACDWIVKYNELSKKCDNLSISFNTGITAQSFSDVIGGKFLTLPNVYWPKDYSDSKHRRRELHKGHIDIGCFGALRPLKNQLIQAFGAILFAKAVGKPLRFHINCDRIEQNGDGIFRNIKALFDATPNATLVCHPWEHHDAFMRTVGKMDLGLQVSFTESFNTVAADFVWQNVPIVVSHDIDWMCNRMKCSADSAYDIAACLMSAYKCGRRGIKEYKKHLVYHNKQAMINWLDVFGKKR